jgi:hypothetical protein
MGGDGEIGGVGELDMERRRITRRRITRRRFVSDC